MALKLLHTADWHLGRKFPTFGERDALTLCRARLEVVERILELAERYSVDAVLCAGDVFDQPRPEPHWYRGLAETLGRASPARPIVLLPGNHDPLLANGSVWDPAHELRRLLPAWVHVVDRDGFALDLSPDAVLHAVPCRSQAGEKDLARQLPARAPGDERLRIGLVHGMTFDLAGHETNFPIRAGAAAERGLDYLALGDTHGFREVEPAAPAPTVYPGAPEATTFGEPDAGHVAIVFFPRRGRRALVRKERVARWRWREVVCRDVAALRALRDGEDLRQCVVRLALDMAVSIRETDEVERILVELEGTDATHGRAGILQVDRSRLRFAAEARPDEFPADLPDSLKAAVARLEERASDGADSETARRALFHLWRLVHERA
ncbi:MAG TPA: DNA repair exonuclease [Planctomycetota bacterium]|nr:DNA repair exonuclease [Planctomycetota bacterium]